uniref:hypothetical protein n=1 Tax=Tessaracoccus bendigoensis TaxID=72764 RepID=UPI00111479AE|nr:hypothetical protein [Tessaracoccus bendigoensis]
MTEYAETNWALATVVMFAAPVIVSIVTIAGLVALRRSGLRSWYVIVGSIAALVVVLTIMAWAPTISQPSGIELSCDAAFEVAAFQATTGNVFPEWARVCKTAGLRHLLVAVLISVIWGVVIVLIARGRRLASR